MDSSQLLAVKTAIETGNSANIMEYLRVNNIDERPMDVRKQLVGEFGREVMVPIFQGMMKRPRVMPQRVGAVIKRFTEMDSVTVDDCDDMISALADAIQIVTEKKDGLQA